MVLSPKRLSNKLADERFLASLSSTIQSGTDENFAMLKTGESSLDLSMPPLDDFFKPFPFLVPPPQGCSQIVLLVGNQLALLKVRVTGISHLRYLRIL